MKLYVSAPEIKGSRQRRIYRATLVGSAVNVLLTVFKFFAGIAGHSSAMIADAVHSLTDLVTDIIVLVFVKIAGKPEDDDHNYGHGKYETLATLIVGLILGGVGAGMLWGGVRDTISFFGGELPERPNMWALAAAVLSIAAKEWLFHYTRRVAKATRSSVLEANAWHHRSDSVTSVATLLGIGGAMLLGGSWLVLDSLAAAFVSVYIIMAAIGLVRPALDELLEKSLGKEEIEAIKDIVTSNGEISSFHHLRTRRIGSQVAVSLHIKMPGDFTLYHAHDVATDVERRIKERFGMDSVVAVHMEPEPCPST